MQNLVEILGNVLRSETIGKLDVEIEQIDFDSRKVINGSLFVAIAGTQTDGHTYIEKAIHKGASAIICEKLPEEIEKHITYIKVPDSAKALGIIADNFYDRPSEKIKLIGITGTNGKTSCVTLLYRLFMKLGFKVGMLSTVENKIAGKNAPATHTTPDSVTLHALLAEMVEAGCEYAFMEVSSHAIHQHRIGGVRFQGGVFTNITHDHLNYHGTFKEYIRVKKLFFDGLPKSAFALTNIDDKRGSVMIQNSKAETYSYSLKKLSDYKAKILDNGLTGLHLEMDGQEVFTRLIGEFNAYNLMAVYGTAVQLGIDKTEILIQLSQLQTAEGRFDYVVHPSKNITGIVDYAHTPDALEKVLLTIQNLRKGKEQVITVVGCGGDRDKTKRPIMAKTACDYSDQVILTSDNPRTEKPETIIEEMEKGIPPDAIRKTLSITNRKQAIKTACKLAQRGDIILIAGKGHEKYQEIEGHRYPFDDKQVLKEALED